ncbi:NADPH-dependent F420 reductase [Actinoplanes sp. NEAU-A12]|uniref:NADPH-dependent F420 reductase n=1 Tax=Actinoplanes sandaracinus TaxID=3045177 RepID=A0ABT6WC39_9ACTN|nr:NADPH-dependent F420 reductase [Actinoplanes sandaracinus]MDI6097286.1 NADPH-dependent F420 reductase [Actinoplanes sandaracinus]
MIMTTCRASRFPGAWNRPARMEVRDDMTTIGLIGSGNIGSTVARLAVAAGHDVVLSNSRGPQTLQELVAGLGPRARAATPAEAAAAGDIVVVTVPLRAYQDIPVAPLAGKVVVDTNNYYPDRDGVFPELEDGSTTTGELLQKHLAESHVVKGFNNIWFEHLRSLARPAGSADRSALPISGDDAAAKRAVTEFLDSIGYDTVDVGPLAENRRTQRDTPVYVNAYGAYGDPVGSPASAESVRKLVAAAG